MSQCRLCHKRTCQRGFYQYCIECTKSVVYNASLDQEYICQSAVCETFPVAPAYKKFDWLPDGHMIYNIDRFGKIAFKQQCIHCASREDSIQAELKKARGIERLQIKALKVQIKKRKRLEKDLENVRPIKQTRFNPDPVPDYLPLTPDIPDPDVILNTSWKSDY